MKKLFKIYSLIFGLVLALCMPSKSHAQAAVDTFFGSVYNTQNDYFVDYDFDLYFTVDYYSIYGPDTASWYLNVQGTLAPDTQDNYIWDLWGEAIAAANWDCWLKHSVLPDTVDYVWTNIYSVSEYRNDVYQRPASPPSSTNYSIPAGVPWQPTLSGGYGGMPMWCAAGGTPWQTGDWSSPVPGTYDLYVCVKSDAGYEGNVTDPIQGRLMIRTVPYTVTVY